MSESWYDRHLFPYLVDFSCSTKTVRDQRKKVVPLAKGHVLEVGIGTGLNMPYYDKSKVEDIVGLDPALRTHRLASRRIASAGLKVELIGLTAEKMPLDNGRFDTVVVTYTLCSIPD